MKHLLSRKTWKALKIWNQFSFSQIKHLSSRGAQDAEVPLEGQALGPFEFDEVQPLDDEQFEQVAGHEQVVVVVVGRVLVAVAAVGERAPAQVTVAPHEQQPRLFMVPHETAEQRKKGGKWITDLFIELKLKALQQTDRICPSCCTIRPIR